MDQFGAILGDLGFASGDEVIDSDLIGEIECAIGAARPGPSRPKTPSQIPVTSQVAPSRETANLALPRPKPGQFNPTAQTAPSRETSGVALPRPRPTPPPSTTQVAPSRDTAGVAIPKGPASATRPDRLAASNKRIATAQANLRGAVRSTLDKASRLKTRAAKLASKPISARAGARLAKMSDRLAQVGTQLKKLADKKQLTKTVQRPVARSASPKPAPTAGPKLAPAGKLLTSTKKTLLGAVLEEVFGDTAAYDPYTAERDPQTLAEAQAYVDAAKQAYDEAKKEELATAEEVKRIRESPEAGTGDNPAYDDAIAAGMEAALARGDAGQTLAYGNELLAAMKDQPAPPPSTDTNAPPPSTDTSTPPPPSTDTSAPPPPSTDTSAPPPPSTDTSAPPPSTEPGSEPFPPGSEPFPPGSEPFPPGSEPFPPTGEWYPHGSDPYGGFGDPFGGFADPFAGVPVNMERPTRGSGGWDDFGDSTYDPDTDLEATSYARAAVSERAATSATKQAPASYDSLPEYESDPLAEEFAEDAASEYDSTPPAEGVVGSYLLGTDVLVSSVF